MGHAQDLPWRSSVFGQITQFGDAQVPAVQSGNANGLRDGHLSLLSIWDRFRWRPTVSIVSTIHGTEYGFAVCLVERLTSHNVLALYEHWGLHRDGLHNGGCLGHFRRSFKDRTGSRSRCLPHPIAPSWQGIPWRSRRRFVHIPIGLWSRLPVCFHAGNKYI